MQLIMVEMVLKLKSHAVQIWAIQMILLLPHVCDHNYVGVFLNNAYFSQWAPVSFTI